MSNVIDITALLAPSPDDDPTPAGPAVVLQFPTGVAA
jgi:hypothetical protein